MTNGDTPAAQPVDTPASEAADGPVRVDWDLVTRVVIAAVVLVGVELWCRRHLGRSFRALPVVGSALLLLSLIGTLCAIAQNRKETDVKIIIGYVVTFLTSWSTLAVVIPVLLVLGSLWTSVTVRTSAAEDERNVVVHTGNADEGRSARTKGGTAVVSWLFTPPWGRRLTVVVAGYEQHEVLVHPWIGRTVGHDDMAVAPTVLIRVPPNTFKSLSKGFVELWWRSSGTWKRIGLVDTQHRRGAVVFGFPRRPGDDLIQSWRDELDRTANPDAATIEAIVTKWTDPLEAKTDMPLRGHLELAARLRIRAGERTSTAACARFETEGRAVEDVELEPAVQEHRPCDELDRALSSS